MSYSIQSFEKKSFFVTKKGVEEILSGYAESRGDDLVLLFLYWAKHDHPIFKQVLAQLGVSGLHKLTKPSTIRKLRQIIQNKEKKYLPTNEEALIRSRRALDVKIWDFEHRITRFLDDSLFPEEELYTRKLEDSWIPEQ